MNNILIFILGFVFSIICLYIARKLALFMMKKFWPEYLRICPECGVSNVKPHTKICFDCGFHFTHKNSDEDILYCPYCGKKTYGFDEESYDRFEKEYPNIMEDNDNENII